MAYGKTSQEVPHVRHEVRMDQDRRLQGRLQHREGTGRQRPGRNARPRGRRGRKAQGDVGLSGVRLRAHVHAMTARCGAYRRDEGVSAERLGGQCEDPACLQIVSVALV